MAKFGMGQEGAAVCSAEFLEHFTQVSRKVCHGRLKSAVKSDRGLKMGTPKSGSDP